MKTKLITVLFLVACGSEATYTSDPRNAPSPSPSDPPKTESPPPTTPSESILCSGSLVNTNFFEVTYAVTVQADGSAYATASLQNRSGILVTGDAKYGAPKNQIEAEAPVDFAYELVSPNFGGKWRVSLNRKTIITTVEYDDPGYNGGSAIWMLKASACSRAN